MSEIRIPKLVPVAEAIRSGEGIPSGFYLILKHPAPLAGSEHPYGVVDWSLLYRCGFRHVVCLSSETPRYNPEPLKLLAGCELDDLSMRKRPLQPTQEAKSIFHIAGLMADSLRSGDGVIVHCAAGRGRTGSVLGATLRLLGVPADTVIEHLDALHRRRSGSPWPESRWQSDLVRGEF